MLCAFSSASRYIQCPGALCSWSYPVCHRGCKLTRHTYITRALGVAAAAWWALGVSPTQAAPEARSIWEVALEPATGRAEATLELPAEDLARYLRAPAIAQDAKGAKDAKDAKGARAEASRYLRDHLGVFDDGASCPRARTHLELLESGRLRWRATYRCPAPLGRVRLANTVMTRGRHSYQHLGQVRVDGELVRRHTFDVAHPTLTLPLSPPGASDEEEVAPALGPWGLVALLGALGLAGLLGWRRRRRS